MATVAVKHNIKQVQAHNRAVMKLHRIAVQKGMAAALTRTRLRAESYILDNDTGIRNPYMANKYQAPTPGRLTSRTGKLKYMLKYGADLNNPLKSWKNFGSILCNEDTVALKGLIRAKRTSATTEQYVGTYRVSVQRHGRLFSTGSKGRFSMPQESVKTLAMRFMWETGIRGQKRPIFEPVSDVTDFDMKKQVSDKNNLIWR